MGLRLPYYLAFLFGVFYLIIYYKRTGELYRFMRERRIEREVK
jgi:hypothetical protein